MNKSRKRKLSKSTLSFYYTFLHSSFLIFYALSLPAAQEKQFCLMTTDIIIVIVIAIRTAINISVSL